MDATPGLKIAIVGGGIAGLYCLYRLLNDMKKEEGEREFVKINSVALYESSDHLGGRIETWSLKRDPAHDLHYAPTWDPRHVPPSQGTCTPFEAPDRAEYFRAEFGPMRIEPRDQPLLKRLLQELEIREPRPKAPENLNDLVLFPSYASKDPESAQFQLSGEEAEQKDSLDLLKLGIRRIIEMIDDPTDFAPEKKKDDDKTKHWRQERARDAWRHLHKPVYHRYWKSELSDWFQHLEDYTPGDTDGDRPTTREESDYAKIRTFTINGHPLWDMGFWNLLHDVLSHYAVVKIRVWGSYYHFLHENLNAAEWLIFWLKALKSDDALRGIRGGMSRIIYRLLGKLCQIKDGLDEIADDPNTIYKALFGDGKRIHLERKLTSLKLEDSGKVQLVFNGDTENPVTADHVILALPKWPLDQLQLPELFKLKDDARDCKAALAAVQGLPLLKCFFILDNPWWKEDRKFNSDAADVPTREIRYHLSDDKTKGMIMIYTDYPALTFWSDYLREFQSAAEPEQLHSTIWWKDKVRLPSSPDVFDRKSEWRGGSRAIIDLYRKPNPGALDKWACIEAWWYSLSCDDQKTQRQSLDPSVPEQKALAQYFKDAECQQIRLWNRFVLFAREYEHHDISADRLLACGIHDWGKEPFGGAAHGWLPGEQARVHIDYLANFPESGVHAKKLHVCGEAFSDYQGFIEGALRSAEIALDSLPKRSLPTMFWL